MENTQLTKAELVEYSAEASECVTDFIESGFIEETLEQVVPNYHKLDDETRDKLQEMTWDDIKKYFS